MRSSRLAGPLLAAAALVSASAASATRTQVLVIASMHGLHKTDPNYGYDRLYSLVADFDPDVVGVELRPEDIDADDDYLSKSYPHEMIELRDRYRGRVVGFDWLGRELAGKPIPSDWWAHGSKVKAIERTMSADPKMSDAESKRISDAQAELLKTATPASLTDGRYYRLVRQQRGWLARHTANTPYEPWVRFNNDREAHIDRNLAKIVRDNPGRRIVIVMGGDHHGFAVDSLRATFGNKIKVLLPK